MTKKYRFKVLCNDAADTCKHVMGDMETHYHVPVKKSFTKNGTGDHYMDLECDNISTADKVSGDISQRYSKLIKSVTVAPL